MPPAGRGSVDVYHCVAGLAVQGAHRAEVAHLLLAGDRGVRPAQRLSLDCRVRHVVVAERVGERGQHRRLTGARRPRDHDREHLTSVTAARRRRGCD